MSLNNTQNNISVLQVDCYGQTTSSGILLSNEVTATGSVSVFLIIKLNSIKLFYCNFFPLAFSSAAASSNLMDGIEGGITQNP